MSLAPRPVMQVPHNLRLDQAPARSGSQPLRIDADEGVSKTILVNGGNAMVLELPDGGAVVDLNPGKSRRAPAGADVFSANLAEFLEEGEVNTIASELIQGVEQDDQSRQQWLETRAQGIALLGLRIEGPRSDAQTSTAVEGMSTVHNPLLLESVVRFQANARGELLPAEGPVKVANVLGDEGDDDDAEELERDLNYFFTDIATEYYPDTDRSLFMVGAGGSAFKKIYSCPIRRRPVSESVDAKDLIVSDATTDMGNAARVTHVIRMRPSILKRMQLLDAYRDVPLTVAAVPQATSVDRAMAAVAGVQPNVARPEDADREIYECYCELDIPGFEHKTKRGIPTGLPLPYRVAIDKDSRQILEIRRNWRDGDDQYLSKRVFVKYPFVPGMGFYDLGLIHLLGNTTRALTAGWRELLDAGMFANFPGFLYRKSAGKQLTNTFRVPPGGGVPIDIPEGKSIQDSVMPLPYKDLSAAFAGFLKAVEEYGQKVGGSAEVSIGEGTQNAPVGTTLAMIEQATKLMSAVHKRLHAAQKEEFGLIKELFREDPESFVRCVQRNGKTNWSVERFVAALNCASLSPRADPNTPSHMHRLMKAQALGQMVSMDPGAFNKKNVYTRILNMLGFESVDDLFAEAGTGDAPPDPKLEVAKINAESKLKTAMVSGQIKQHQIETQAATDIEQLKIQQQTAQEKAAGDDRKAQIKTAADLAKLHSGEKIAGLHAITEATKIPKEEAAPEQPGDSIAGALGVVPQPSGGESV